MPDIQKRIDTRWQNLQETLRGIPDDRMTEAGVCGEWSVKDLLGHIAYWDDHNVEEVEALIKNQEIPGEDNDDVDRLNAEVAAERAGWSLTQARQEFEAAHRRKADAFIQNADQVVEAWGEAADDVGRHYDEHAEQIRTWREQQGI